MRPRYPLEPLVQVRQLEVDARGRELATQALKVRQAAELRASKEADLAEERARTERARDSEREHLASGRARAADLARSAEFEVGARLREHDQKQALDTARRHERAAETAERQARAELGRARAHQKALGRHHQRFVDTARRASEQQAEDDALEAHRSGAREEGS